MSIAAFITGGIGPGSNIPLFITRGLGSYSVVRGRRHTTRSYKLPVGMPEPLEESYVELKKQGHTKELRALVGPYLLRGDVMPKRAAPKASSVDWVALAQDAEAIQELVKLYKVYEEDEETVSLLLLM